VKWLIDEMLPPALAEALASMGHDAVAVADLQMQGASDEEVLDRAVTEGRTIVTENFADFATLVGRRQANDLPCTPVVLVRKSSFPAGGALPAHLAEHLDQWATANPDPYEGLHWP
jgi:hypothetical protein